MEQNNDVRTSPVRQVTEARGYSLLGDVADTFGGIACFNLERATNLIDINSPHSSGVINYFLFKEEEELVSLDSYSNGSYILTPLASTGTNENRVHEEVQQSTTQVEKGNEQDAGEVEKPVELGYGITRVKSTGRWNIQLKVGPRRVHIGYFAERELAHVKRVRDAAVKERARLNELYCGREDKIVVALTNWAVKGGYKKQKKNQ